MPLRVLLVLLDEVFDLREQGQWLRRQLTILLKQLAGDKLSRKVVETIDWLTSPEQVAEYIRDLRYMLHPFLRRTGLGCALCLQQHSLARRVSSVSTASCSRKYQVHKSHSG